ncbi:MAG: hypothetical protein JWN48_2396 [Myxococcaceae bacterium]|nr:hypothetical protein [Myxococcaceae bacterium]
MKISLPVLSLVLLAALPSMVSAAEVLGITLPNRIVVQGKELTLNGIGVRSKTIFRIKVYVAGLYLEEPHADAAAILASDTVRRLELHMTHAATSDRLKGELLDGLERNAKAGLASLQPRLDKLLAALPALQEGQTLVVSYVPGQGTTLQAAGRQVTAPGKDLADALLRAWLGENPLDESLKKQLLGIR